MPERMAPTIDETYAQRRKRRARMEAVGRNEPHNGAPYRPQTCDRTGFNIHMHRLFALTSGHKLSNSWGHCGEERQIDKSAKHAPSARTPRITSPIAGGHRSKIRARSNDDRRARVKQKRPFLFPNARQAPGIPEPANYTTSNTSMT